MMIAECVDQSLVPARSGRSSGKQAAVRLSLMRPSARPCGTSAKPSSAGAARRSIRLHPSRHRGWPCPRPDHLNSSMESGRRSLRPTFSATPPPVLPKPAPRTPASLAPAPSLRRPHRRGAQVPIWVRPASGQIPPLHPSGLGRTRRAFQSCRRLQARGHEVHGASQLRPHQMREGSCSSVISTPVPGSRWGRASPAT